MKLFVVMPVYNARATLREIIGKVLAAPIEIELLCVDDGFAREILGELQSHPKLRVLLQPKNMGKGVALRRGIRKRRETSLSFRTLTSSMTRASIRNCWSRSSRVEPTWFTGLAF